MNNTKTPGREFYDEQIRQLEANNLDGLMAHYHDDAVLVGYDFTVRGLDALRDHFIEYLKSLGSIKVISTDQFNETEDSIFFEATVGTDIGIAKVYDVFILRDGKASHHFTGLISVNADSSNE